MMEFKNNIFKNNVRSVSVSMCTPTDINTTRLRNFENVPGFTIFFTEIIIVFKIKRNYCYYNSDQCSSLLLMYQGSSHRASHTAITGT